MRGVSKDYRRRLWPILRDARKGALLRMRAVNCFASSAAVWHANAMFDAVVFAGGGNRCYWQGGFYETAAPRLGLIPELVVAASAGAFAAAYSLLGTGAQVRQSVYDGCGPHLKNFDLAAWRRGEPLCPVGPLYNELLVQTIDDAALAATTSFGVSPSRGAAVS